MSDKIVVDKGKPGLDVDLEKLYLLIGQQLTFNKSSTIYIPTFVVDPTINNKEAEALQKRAKQILSKIIVLRLNEQEFSYSDDELLKLLNPKGAYNDTNLDILISDLALEIDHDPQNPIFVFEDNIVKEFSPAIDGVSLDQEKLKELFVDNLSLLESSDKLSLSFDMPINTAPPDYQTEEVNELGIKELIGRGTSKFAGSITSRIHNISVASAKFNGVLIKPNSTFSFNNTLGDVSTFTGYKQAYVIKDGKTVLGDGGGVCQVSTTFFRAILDAGLPIVERRAHSYRVTYYEQDAEPGLDATVYAPTTDLKFKNDTPDHLLIQTLFDPKTASLVFEIYGTSDGRVSTISKPVVTDVSPPPEDLYTDDPTLPSGEVKQIDWKAWGAKVWFDYSVERGGEIIYEKTFYSNFRPWQAKFLRGTGPVI